MKVRLCSNDKNVAEATDRTIQALVPYGSGGHLKRGENGEIEFDENGLATIEGGDEGFMRFALVRQGYVQEIVG